MTDEAEDDAVLAEQLFAAVGALRRTTRRATGRLFPVDQVAGAQLELVRVVRRQPGISVGEASIELGLVPNTVSTLVRQLVERDLLTRSPDPVDRRVARLSLTPGARRRTERWRDDRAALSRGVAVIGRLTALIGAPADVGVRRG